jgi:hypothetical protein
MEYKDKDKIFKMHYDNSRLLINTENFTNLKDSLLDSNTISDVELAKNLRRERFNG